jgi:hypothetical protein
MEEFIHLIGSRTRDLAACNMVPHPTTAAAACHPPPNSLTVPFSFHLPFIYRLLFFISFFHVSHYSFSTSSTSTSIPFFVTLFSVLSHFLFHYVRGSIPGTAKIYFSTPERPNHL